MVFRDTFCHICDAFTVPEQRRDIGEFVKKELTFPILKLKF